MLVHQTDIFIFWVQQILAGNIADSPRNSHYISYESAIFSVDIFAWIIAWILIYLHI